MRCQTCDTDGLVGVFCTACGSALVESTSPCTKCGNQQATGSFCNQCGASLQVDSCRACSSKGQTGKHCTNCGSLLDPDFAVQNQTFGSLDLTLPDYSGEEWNERIAYCRICFNDTKMYSEPGVLVSSCTSCGADAKNIKF